MHFFPAIYLLCTTNAAILHPCTTLISLSSSCPSYDKLLKIRAAQTVLKEAESGGVGGDMEVKGEDVEADPPQLDDDQIVSVWV